MVFLVGLTGGIAAGKSTVARGLADRGAHVVDADALAREVVEPGNDALTAVAEHFGPDVLTADGRLDRARLSARVFADASQRRALEAITHPAIRALFRQRVHALEREDPHGVVVYDVPLLVESAASEHPFDLVAVVEAPAEVRVQRLVAERGVGIDEARRRVAAQASDAERRAVADVVLDTSGTLAETEAQTQRLWRLIGRRRS